MQYIYIICIGWRRARVEKTDDNNLEVTATTKYSQHFQK
jgi:hypothetical protein